MGCGASSASKPLPETAAPANSPAAGPPAGSKVVTLDEILNDSKVRAWVDTLPEVCLSEATRPYTAEELAAADKVCAFVLQMIVECVSVGSSAMLMRPHLQAESQS